jgi:hypothetical protein
MVGTPAVRLLRGQLDAPLEGMDIMHAGGEAQPGAIGLGSEEGLEGPRRFLPRHAAPIILHFYDDIISFDGCPERQTPLAIGQGLERVQRDIQNDLFQDVLVARKPDVPIFY